MSAPTKSEIESAVIAAFEKELARLKAQVASAASVRNYRLAANSSDAVIWMDAALGVAMRAVKSAFDSPT